MDEDNRMKPELWENAPWLQKNAEEINEARKSRETDDPFDVLFYDSIAIKLSHRFIKAGVSANSVTFLSLLFGVGGSILLYSPNRLIDLLGMAFIIFAAILDCCDGQIARLTDTSSQLGRVLDGTVDILNFFAIYCVLGLRMMNEMIPFTGVKWGVFVWIPIIICIICHADQARIADYYRGLHLFFLEGSNLSYMTRSEDLKEELASLKKDSPLFERLYRVFYLIYTRDQERQTPRVQKLLKEIEKRDNTVSEEVSEAYITQSRKYIRISGALTYNIRTYGLFIAILFRVPVLYFIYVIIVLELVKVFVVIRYEAIARNVFNRFYQ